MYHDHHFHPLGYARLVNGLELFDAHDLANLLESVAAHASTREGPVIGQRVNDENLAEQRLPTRSDIDDVVGDRPVLLYRYCGHIAMANSAALALAGVDQATLDPPGGRLDRDATGTPNGILRETAVHLVANALAPITAPPTDEEILAALAGLGEVGIGSVTGIIAAGDPLWCGVGNELEIICRLAPQLSIDMLLFVTAGSPLDLEKAAQSIREAEGRVTFGGWKEWSDGSFGGRTAAMHEPYADDPATRGLLRIEPSFAVEMGEKAMSLGGGVAIHAIGDRANDLVLEIHRDLITRGAEPSRLRIEHASILDGAAIERMARLGVTASVQPAFLASEESWLVRRLGEDRLDRTYPFRSMAEAGIPLIGGSDSPVESPDPRIGINAAVDRHGIAPAEALTPDAAENLFRPPRS